MVPKQDALAAPQLSGHLRAYLPPTTEGQVPQVWTQKDLKDRSRSAGAAAAA